MAGELKGIIIKAGISGVGMAVPLDMNHYPTIDVTNSCDRQPYCLAERNSRHRCKCETVDEYKRRAGWRAY